MKIAALIMSCTERHATFEATRARLTAGGWPHPPELILDEEVGADALERIHHTWRRLVKRGAETASDFVLLLEDDVVFGTHFYENVMSWGLLTQIPKGHAFYASLYNPNHPYLARRVEERYQVADPRFAWGAQAILMTPSTARFIDAHWERAPGNPDQRMPLIAAQVTAIYYHVPSLVDHAPVPTTWGGRSHAAFDFDVSWRAAATGMRAP